MTALRDHRTVHFRVVQAPAQTLYGLVADVTRWPVIFEPTIYVKHLERGERQERFQLWALVNGQVKTWTSRRTLDPDELRITFRQERSQAPIASMGGEWRFHPRPGGGTEVVLTHYFSAAENGEGEDSDSSSSGGDGDRLAWITAGVDRNSQRELAALARLAELPHPVDDLVFTFSDRMRLSGSAAGCYDFVDRSDAWPDRLPHVSRVRLNEEPAGVQDMEMDTVMADGSAHTTRSIRLCFPSERIVYKQLVPPALLFGHSGSWDFATGPGGAQVTARHTVAINPAAIASVLGPGRTLDEARTYLRDALGANSRTTLSYADAHGSSRTPPDAHSRAVEGGP